MGLQALADASTTPGDPSSQSEVSSSVSSMSDARLQRIAQQMVDVKNSMAMVANQVVSKKSSERNVVATEPVVEPVNANFNLSKVDAVKSILLNRSNQNKAEKTQPPGPSKSENPHCLPSYVT